MQKALLVDDEEIVLDLLEAALLARNYAVVRTNGADRAIEALQNDFFDVVITDLQMGEISGLEVVRQAKKCHPESFVIMMTGCYEARYAVEAYRRGADDYLLKPFSLHDLLERLQIQALKKRFIPSPGQMSAQPVSG